MPRKVKLVLAPLILLVTLGAFAHYLSGHPELIAQLKQTSPGTVAWVLLLYCVWFFALILLLAASLRMYRKAMPRQENFLLNAYSSLINFFGPGQSGPAVRGAYLYKRHGVRLKDYMFTTFLYYAFYAVISAFLLFAGSRPVWQTFLLLVLVATTCFSFIRRYARRSRIAADKPALTPSNVGLIGLAAVLQAIAQVAIYFVELQSVHAHVSLAQVTSYTGAANFSLFVALTPGAIGIRESFLLFTQQLHHIGSQTIVAANVIDRGVYVLFLGLLFALVVSLHAKAKLRIK